MMFFLDGFLAGLGSVLTFGWPKTKSYPIASPKIVIADDWQRISKDINIAISKYKVEEKNGKA